MTTLTLRPATGPHVWRNADYFGRTDWIEHFSPAELAELETAAQRVRARKIVLEEATKNDFALPLLSSRLAVVRAELATGRGFVMLRGIPVQRYSEEELGTLFWGLGTHLGIGVSQSLKGDRLGHVMDISGDLDRYYTRGGELEFHMDPVDVVGLLCLRAAFRGGESRIVSSMAVHNSILSERPDMMAALMRGYHYSRRAQDPGAQGAARYTAHRVPVFMEGGDGKECYFLPASIRGAARDGAPLSAGEREAWEYVADVAARPELYLDMSFAEGDIQFLNNRKILHARTDYVEDPIAKRHLLRLWLMMPDWPERPTSMRPHDGADRAGGGIAKAG